MLFDAVAYNDSPLLCLEQTPGGSRQGRLLFAVRDAVRGHELGRMLVSDRGYRDYRLSGVY